MGQHPDGIPMTVARAKAMMKQGRLPLLRSSNNLVAKDTVSIPSKGYAVVRFKADNPGWWFIHCHFGKKENISSIFTIIIDLFAEYHTEIGMGVILQVGEPNQMKKVPRDFPKCHNFKPLVHPNQFKP